MATAGSAQASRARRTCAYTNHTILAEALEKWPLSFIEKVAPQLAPIIRELDRRAREACADPAVARRQGGLLHVEQVQAVGPVVVRAGDGHVPQLGGQVEAAEGSRGDAEALLLLRGVSDGKAPGQ